MDPKVNPQGTLSQIDSPLLAPPQQAPPTATDTNVAPGAATLQNPVSGSATLGQRFPDFASNWKANFASATKKAISTGMSPLAASVVGAIHANDPSTTPVQKEPQQPGIGAQALAGLGDAAAVGTVSPGGGWLQGLERTASAQTQRFATQKQQQFQNQQEESKNNAIMAEANLNMQKEQLLLSKLGNEAVQQGADNGKAQLDAMRASGQQFNVVGGQMDSDALHDWIKKNGITLKTQQDIAPDGEVGTDTSGNLITAVPDGVKVVGEDKNHAPITRMTYTLTTVPKSINLDPKNDGMQGAIKLLDQYNPKQGGGSWAGADMSGIEFNLAMQQAHNSVAQDLAVRQARLQAGYKLDEVKKGEEVEQFKNSPEWQSALAHAPQGNIVSARNALLQQSQDPKSPLYGKFPNLDNDIREMMGFDKKSGASVYDKMLEDYQKRQDQNITDIVELQKTVDKAHGEEAAGLAASLGQKIKETPNMDPMMKGSYQRMIAQASAAARSSQVYDTEKKQNEQKVNNAIEQEDLPVLVDAAVNYQLDPNKLFSMRKNTNAEFKAQMLAKDPTWSEAKYKQRYTMQQELASDKSNSMGGQIESLNRFGLHSAEANRGIQGLRNMNSPIINTPLNKIKSGMVGFPEAQAFKIKAETVKGEYLNFINNGHVPPTDEEERLAAQVGVDRTPAELQDTFRAMAEVVAARAHSMNGRYATIMGGGNIPGLLQPDTENILRQFGVDTKDIYNTTGTTGFSSDINKTPAQQKADKNLPPPANGMIRVKLPKSGTLMDFPKDSPAYNEAIKHGAVAQ